MNQEVKTINGYNIKDEKAIRTYDTVALMQADSKLSEGQHVKTRGYYQINDGGGCEYYITTQSDTDIQEILSNGLYATLIIENNTINIKQLGAKSQDKENNKYDIKSYVDKYLNLIENGIQCKLYIPSGVYYASPINLSGDNRVYIYGDETFSLWRNGTIITSLNDNQNYILNIGNESEDTRYFVLKNLVFSSYDYAYSDNLKTFYQTNRKTITDSVLKFLQSSFGIVDNLFFAGVGGRCIYLTTSWEIYFNKLNFRNIYALNSSILCFGTKQYHLSQYPNITACTFENFMFEQVLGDLVEFEENCDFFNNVINNFNFEDYEMGNIEYLTDFSTLEPYTKESIFKIDGGAKVQCIINNIFINNLKTKYSVINNNHYCFDTILNIPDNEKTTKIDVLINNIQIVGLDADGTLIYSKSQVSNDCKLVINNITTEYNESYILDTDVENFGSIVLNNILYSGSNNTRERRIHKLNGKLHSFYEVRRYGGRVTKDNDALSLFGLCNCLKGITMSNLICIESLNDLHFVAKVPLGREVTFTLYAPDRFKTLTVTGTGEFEDYEMSLDTRTKLGEFQSLQTNDENNDDILLDYYYFE